MALGGARREVQRVEIGLEAPLDAGPQDFHRNGLPVGFRLMHLRDGRRRDRGAERRIDVPQRLAECGGDLRLGVSLRERRHAVLQALQIARERGTDDIGARCQELPELDVSRPEARQRSRKLAGRVAPARPLQQSGDTQSESRRRGQRGRIGQTEHTFARKDKTGARQTKQMTDRRDHKRQPECSATMPPLISRCDTRRKARRAHHVGERIRAREAADRFDEIAIRLGIAHDRAADRRHDIERIELVQRIEPGHIDIGEFKTQEPPSDAQHAMHFGERHVDARHVADAERDRHRIEALFGNGSASALASTNVTASSSPRSSARSRPTASMSALMSATVARVPVPPAAMVRNDTSPVPPATSSSAKSRLGFRAD